MNAQNLNGGVRITPSAWARNVPKRPSASTTAIAHRPIASSRRNGSGSGLSVMPGRGGRAPARLAPTAVAVLPPLEPAHGPLDVLVAEVLADRAEPTEDGPGAVDVVHTPASVPRPVVPLRVAEEVERALRRLELAVVAERAEELEAASRQVLRRGIEQRAVVGERDVVEVEALVVRIERRPASVLPLHAEEPAEAALLREPRRIGVEPVDLLERHEHHRGVIEVRIEVVVVLERPAARPDVRPFHLPVTRDENLAVDEPLRRAAKRRVRGREAALDQRVDRERGVPHGGRAGLIVELLVRLDRERLDLLDLPEHQRVVVGVAEHAHREDRDRHRRVDPAAAAGHGEPLLEPHARRLDRALAERACGEALPDLEAVVDGDEEVLPESGPPPDGFGTRGERRARFSPRPGPKPAHPRGG